MKNILSFLIVLGSLFHQAQTFPFSYKFLDTNNVKALIGTTNIKHWDCFSNAEYRVPKNLGPSAVFASSFWIGGLDESGLLHLAAETYRQSGRDFWPGPLDTTNAASDSITSQPFNKVWKISCNQINQFAANANNFNFSANSAPTFSDINSFIGNGNNTNNFATQLSPYYDGNNNGVYEPGLGEYPFIRGHQQIYSVYNDNYGAHTETGGLPLGIEVHERSFAYHLPSLPDTMQVINNTTFYNFEVINRSSNNYNNVYMTLWADVDLGYYLNDYIGTDTLNEFGYVYNGTNSDPIYSGTNGYQNKLPMIGLALLPRASNQNDGVDNNNNGQVDEPNERFRLNLTTFYNNNIGAFPPPTTNPATKWHYYNYMSGRWKDSSFFKPSGTAYNPTLAVSPARHVFTGNPQTNSGWTEGTAGLTPGDRRILCTIGPFNFPANRKVEFEYAYVFSCDTSLNNINNNFSLLSRDVKNVRYFMSQQYDPVCAPIVAVGLREKAGEHNSLSVYPNPARETLIVNLSFDTKKGLARLTDLNGKLLYEKVFVNSSAAKLEVVSLPEGIYILQVNDGYKIHKKKIIKKD